MQNLKRDHLALYTGFVLIMIVFVLTVFRAQKNSDTKSANKSASNVSEQTDNAQDYKTISANELQKKILSTIANDSNFQLLDVRNFEDFANEHIIDSQNITPSEFPIEQKLDKNKQIIIIGKDKDDSNIEKAVDELDRENFKNFVVLAGGIESWKQFLGSTVTFGDPKSFVDQSKVEYLDPEQLNEALNQKQPVFIVDVRSTEEFNKGHIRGSINIPFESLEKDREKITERKVVVVGINELQEFQASVQMYDMLLVSPFVMRTAMPGWQQKGFALVQN